jgi:hypothetical protein
MNLKPSHESSSQDTYAECFSNIISLLHSSQHIQTLSNAGPCLVNYKLLCKILEGKIGHNTVSYDQITQLQIWTILAQSLHKFVTSTNSITEKATPFDDDYSLMYTTLVLPFR